MEQDRESSLKEAIWKIINTVRRDETTQYVRRVMIEFDESNYVSVELCKYINDNFLDSQNVGVLKINLYSTSQVIGASPSFFDNST